MEDEIKYKFSFRYIEVFAYYAFILVYLCHSLLEQQIELVLTLFDMDFFKPSVMGGGGGHEGPHHNFVVVAPIIMKFGTGTKLDVFYTMVTKNGDVTIITSL